MNFKSPQPSRNGTNEENISDLFGYIENLKSETEARLTMIENTIERIKGKIETILEVNA